METVQDGPEILARPGRSRPAGVTLVVLGVLLPLLLFPHPGLGLFAFLDTALGGFFRVLGTSSVIRHRCG